MCTSCHRANAADGRRDELIPLASTRRLLAAHEHTHAHWFARLDLSTARTDHAAQALYEALGWVRDEVYFSYSQTV